MPTQEQRAEAGKCWTEKIFRQALEKCKDQFSIEQWSWKKDTWPAYIIQFQIAGEDEIHYIRSETWGFTHGEISDCGNSDSANNPVRENVSRAIYRKLGGCPRINSSSFLSHDL